MISSQFSLFMVILVVTALLCHLFDGWYARTAIRIRGDGAAMLPDRWISWGVIERATLDPQVGPMTLRFFRMKLPIRTFGLVATNYGLNSYNYALRGHWLMWIDGSHLMPTNPMLGWSITPGLE